MTQSECNLFNILSRRIYDLELAMPGAVGVGTVTSVSVAAANGFTGTVATNTTTPAITIIAGAITPSSVASAGAISGTTITATGVVTVPAGTAGAPAIVSTTGTADTGIWFPAADTLALSTAGVERLRMGSSGNVGIGTTSAGDKLEINADNGVGIIVGNSSAQNVGGAFRAFNAGGSDFGANIIGVGFGAINGQIKFTRTQGSLATPMESMRIDASGNVGIGTTTPVTKLSVDSGNISIKLASTAAIGAYYFYEGVTDKAYIQYLGSTSGLAGRSGNLEVETQSGVNIDFRPGSTSKMMILASGNVGIGTTSPGAKLDVVGDLILQGGGINGGKISFGSSGANVFDGAADGSLLRINAAGYTNVSISGNVGVGKTPGTKLDVNGTVTATGLALDKTITAAATVGAQTINKPAGSVNFAAAATSLVVTNSIVTTSSVIICTVGTNDSTMKTVLAVAAAGSFTIFANAAATAETRVNFLVIN